LGWSDVAYAIAVTKVDGRGMHVVRHGSPTGKPAWSPNGMKIAFETGRGRTKLATVNRDGSGFRILARDRHREVTQVSWQRVFSTHHPRRP